MQCPKHGAMTHTKTESNIDLGIKGLRHTEDHYKCEKCKLTGAVFTTMTQSRKRYTR